MRRLKGTSALERLHFNIVRNSATARRLLGLADILLTQATCVKCEAERRRLVTVAAARWHVVWPLLLIHRHSSCLHGDPKGTPHSGCEAICSKSSQRAVDTRRQSGSGGHTHTCERRARGVERLEPNKLSSDHTASGLLWGGTQSEICRARNEFRGFAFVLMKVQCDSFETSRGCGCIHTFSPVPNHHSHSPLCSCRIVKRVSLGVSTVFHGHLTVRSV